MEVYAHGYAPSDALKPVNQAIPLPKITANKAKKRLVRSAGVEPATFAFGGQHSIQLSYERTSAEIPF